MKSLLILGRQPALGLAELESLFGADKIKLAGREAAFLDMDASEVPFERLGGSIKLARVLTTLDSTKWQDIETYLSKTIPEHLQYVPEGSKLKLGLSAYDLRVRAADINVTGLRLKKIIKAEGRSVRIVPNKFPELNSAQVLHNQLTSPTGWELLAVRNGHQTVLAQTFAEQDIEAYAKRDQGRPMRDAKVGMLPPKLAQLLINLAIGMIDESRVTSHELRILDPFCGTGVLLQEALLMGYDVYGTDIEPRMIEYSQKNLQWLRGLSSKLETRNSKLEIGDATTYTWSKPVDTIAAETFLGKPLISLPPPNILHAIMVECDLIHDKFLRNLASQVESGTKLCLAVPAWKSRNGYLHLKTLDHLEKIGYNRIRFKHARNEELVYHRPDQTVARELVVLERK